MAGNRRYDARAAFGTGSGSGGGGAPTTASYVTMVAESGLSNETILSNVIRADVVANRGAFGNPGVLFYSTDTFLLYRDSGTSWDVYTFAQSAISGLATSLAGKYSTLVRTAVKTATTYTAAAQDLVPVDTTSNSVTVTLPTAPANGTLVGIRQIIRGGTNTVTVNTAGSDVFSRAGGPTAATLTLAGQEQIYQYDLATAIWTPISDGYPLSQIDLRFAPITGIPESSVTNLVTDLGAINTVAALNTAKLATLAQAGTGYFVHSGMLLTPNATPTKLDMALGVGFAGTTEMTAAAQAAISTTIASLAPGAVGQSVWAWVEMNASNVINFNPGTALASPVIPDITAARIPLGLLWVPNGAMNVDTAFASPNGNAKLYDMRRIQPLSSSGRLLGTDTSATVNTPTTGFTTMLSGTMPIPANSLRVGDVIDSIVSCRFLNNGGSTTTISFAMLMGGAGAANVAFTTQAANANVHHITFHFRVVVQAVGSGTATKVLPAGAGFIGTPLTLVASESDLANTNLSTGWDNTIPQVLDIQTKVGTATATQSITLAHCSVIKYSAA